MIFANKISMTHAIKGVFCFVVMVNRTDDLTNWTDIVRRLVVFAERFPTLFQSTKWPKITPADLC